MAIKATFELVNYGNSFTYDLVMSRNDLNEIVKNCYFGSDFDKK